MASLKDESLYLVDFEYQMFCKTEDEVQRLEDYLAFKAVKLTLTFDDSSQPIELFMLGAGPLEEMYMMPENQRD